MTEPRTSPPNRRQLLAAMGGASFALALAASSNRASAQAIPDYTDHPLTGMWLAMANPGLPENPQFPAPSLFSPDGYVFLQFPPIDIGANGLVAQSLALGVWEPYDEQTGHFTVVQTLLAPEGNLIGSVTIDGHPHVLDDNIHFIDDFSLTYVTIRDAAGAILQEVPPGSGGRPVTATRMAVGAPGFPSAESATPAATPSS